MTVNTQFKLVIFFLHCITLTINTAFAQVTPANRSEINYRLIGFGVPPQEGVSTYEFVVNEYIITDTGTSMEKTVFKKKSTTNRLVGTVPFWGKSYSWKVNYYADTKLTGSSETYRFATKYNPYADTAKFRIRKLQNSVSNKNLLVFIDGLKSLCDMNGNVLWSLPTIEGIVDSNIAIRDLKISPQKTITFLNRYNAYEIDYNGNVLWQGPNDGKISGDSIEYYHHEFTRLNNGNYMIAGNEKKLLAIPQEDTGLFSNFKPFTNVNGVLHITVEFGTLIEYDVKGNIVWHKKTSDFFPDNYILDKGAKNTSKRNVRTHMNSFYFDDKTSSIYISFRDISSIIKINYPTGKIESIYGTYDTTQTYSLFHGQHSCRVAQNGQVYLFNNDIIDNPTPDNISSIVVLKDVFRNTHVPELVWEFNCNIDTLVNKASGSGGSVYELADGSFLAAMGSVNRVFIVTRDKKVVWNVLIEGKLIGNAWQNISNYRASCIENEEITKELLYKNN